MNLKTGACIFFLIISCLIINTDNDISDKILHTTSLIIGDTQTFEDTAITVSLSFAKIPKPLDFDFLCPITNPIVTSSFGKRLHPIFNTDDAHTGIDIATFDDPTVFATLDGIVTDCGYCDIWGNFITIDHENGYKSFYAHLSEVFETTNVLKGQAIGIIGDSGYATGEHLHFEISKDDIPFDPCLVINFYEY